MDGHGATGKRKKRVPCSLQGGTLSRVTSSRIRQPLSLLRYALVALWRSGAPEAAPEAWANSASASASGFGDHAPRKSLCEIDELHAMKSHQQSSHRQSPYGGPCLLLRFLRMFQYSEAMHASQGKEELQGKEEEFVACCHLKRPHEG